MTTPSGVLSYVRELPAIYHAFLTFLGAAAASEGSVMSVVETTHAMPPAWVHVVALFFSVVTGALSFLKRHQTEAAAAEAAINAVTSQQAISLINEIETVVKGAQSSPPALPPVAVVPTTASSASGGTSPSKPVVPGVPLPLGVVDEVIGLAGKLASHAAGAVASDAVKQVPVVGAVLAPITADVVGGTTQVALSAVEQLIADFNQSR